MISYLELDISIINETVNNESEESGPAKLVIHSPHPRQKLSSAITLFRSTGLQFPRPSSQNLVREVAATIYRRIITAGNKLSSQALKMNNQFPQK